MENNIRTLRPLAGQQSAKRHFLAPAVIRESEAAVTGSKPLQRASGGPDREPIPLADSAAVEKQFSGSGMGLRRRLSQLIKLEARISHHVLVGTLTGLESVRLTKHLNDEISKLRLRMTMQRQEQATAERQLKQEGIAYV